jgi:hypothetical protein
MCPQCTAGSRTTDQRLCTGSRCICIEPRHLAAHPAVLRARSPASRVPALLASAVRGIAIAIALLLPSALHAAHGTGTAAFPASASVCARTAGHCATTRRVERTPASASALVLHDSALPYTRLHSVGKLQVVAQACTHSDPQPRPALTYIACNCCSTPLPRRSSPHPPLR